MQTFKYTAYSRTAELHDGTMQAETKPDVAREIRDRGLIPADIQALRSPRLVRLKKISQKQACRFWTDLSSFLSAGMPIAESLKLLAQLHKNTPLGDVIRDLHQSVVDGTPLHEAFRQCKALCSTADCAMIAASTEGSFLTEAVAQLAALTRQRVEIGAKFKNAMVYPAVLAVTAMTVIFGLLVYFVPQFTPMFETMRDDAELPAITSVLLVISGFLNTNAAIIWIAFAAMVGLFLFGYRSGTDLKQLARRFESLPYISTIQSELSLSRFLRLMGALLGNGVKLDQALVASIGASGSQRLDSVVKTCVADVRRGRPLAESFRIVQWIPLEIKELVDVGERTNTLSEVMLGAADTFENRMAGRLEVLTKLAEPVVLFSLASVIGLFVYGLVVPILRMSTTVG